MSEGWLDRISPQIHHTGHMTFKRGVINPMRVIYDHELFMFSTGQNKLVFGEVEYPCPRNSFIVLPPGRVDMTRSAPLEWPGHGGPNLPATSWHAPPAESCHKPLGLPAHVLREKVSVGF